jgi:Fe-S cluster biogenesis protein NfuA
MLYKGTADFKEEQTAKDWSPIAAELFLFPYVKGVYICNNFVTISKEFTYTWDSILLPLKEFIKGYVANGSEIIREGYMEAMTALEAENRKSVAHSGEQSETVDKIKELIDTYVKPAVEMDGGNIEFKSFSDGIVTVTLQGSCSGCPSSTVTLKSGIEGMLKRMVPEVTEVVSEMG